MKKHFFFLLCMFLTASIFAQEGQDEMMKAWQEYMTPGPMHELLAKGVGEWKAEITMWMDPSQPPTQSEGKAVTETILGGRYFQTMNEGIFMGMPMQGIEVSGYDNAKKKFFSTWIDNFGTGIMYLEGDYDEETKTLNMSGTSTDPMGNEVGVREVIKLIDDDTSFFEMYMIQDEQEMKSMEIKSTRVKETQ